MTALSIRVAASADEARAALADGYEPVECAFGGESVVGPLGLDHHGALADRPPVCRQALSAMSWPDRASLSGPLTRFVAAGPPDADASLAIAILLAGSAGADEDSVYDCISLVSLVAASDLGQWADLSTEGRAGAMILAWHARQRQRGQHGIPATTWQFAVQDWAELIALPEDAPELRTALASEAERVRLAREASYTLHGPEMDERAGREPLPMDEEMSGLGIPLIESPVMGADVWYADHATLRGYIAWMPEAQRISVSIRPGTARMAVSTCDRCAEIGDGERSTSGCGVENCGAPARERDGLLGLIRSEDMVGWGGRPEVIGSPRGVAMTREQAVAIARILAERIDEVSRG